MAIYSTGDQYAQQSKSSWERYTDSVADRQEFIFGEIAADNALERSLYSAKHMAAAQMEGLKNAGLSPSIYASGGVPSGGGASGLNGGGASTHSQQAEKMNAILNASMQATSLASQIAQTKAQIENTKADTRLKDAQAGQATSETQYQNYINENQNVVNKLTNAYILQDPNDETTGTSLFNIANVSNSYSDFIKSVKNIKWGSEIQMLIHTENGQRVLRDIYINSKEQSANIAALNKQQTNDELATQILNVLNQEGYAALSAQEQIEALKKAVEANKLDKETNEAWNNLLAKLGNGTKQDTAIVIGLLIRTLIGQTNFSASRSTVVK